MEGTVQKIELKDGGKARVSVNGQWYSIKGTNGLTEGARIGFDASSWDYKGKTYHGIDKWGLLPEAPHTNGNGAAHHPATPAASPAMVMTGDELRFISNVVGSAITSGTIKDPVDLIAWAKGAQGALKSLTDGVTF